jgi:hypothetical protein
MLFFYAYVLLATYPLIHLSTLVLIVVFIVQEGSGVDRKRKGEMLNI